MLRHGKRECMAVKDFQIFMLISHCVNLEEHEGTVCLHTCHWFLDESTDALQRTHGALFFPRTKDVTSSEAQEGSQIETNRHCFSRMYQYASYQGGVKFEETPEPNNLHESTKVFEKGLALAGRREIKPACAFNLLCNDEFLSGN